MKYWHLIIVALVAVVFVFGSVMLTPDYTRVKAKCIERGGVFIRTMDEQHFCIKREAIIQGDSNG